MFWLGSEKKHNPLSIKAKWFSLDYNAIFFLCKINMLQTLEYNNYPYPITTRIEKNKIKLH